MNWRPEQIAEVRRLIEVDRLTARQASDRLGVSRNAIISVCHRYGITMRPPGVRLTKTGKPIVRNRRVYPKMLIADEPTPIVEVQPLYITLLDLKKNQCRYPVQERPYFFCGHQKQEGSSYCPAHHALCWTKAAKPVRPFVIVRRKAA